MDSRHRERYRTDDPDEDPFDPKSKSFCRACVDVSRLAKALSGKPQTIDTKNCPLDSVSLGNGSWGLLHTMAAYYPDEPSVVQQQSMWNFLKGFSEFYPCDHCAHDFRSNMILHPPKVNSRDALSGWLCLQHNLVNVKLGKPVFDCSRIAERWRHGWKDGSCDIN